MKKATRKRLVLRSETLQVLRALDKGDLARAVGGRDDNLAVASTNTQSGINCPVRAGVVTA
jgi:hypothetical protein